MLSLTLAGVVGTPENPAKTLLGFNVNPLTLVHEPVVAGMRFPFVSTPLYQPDVSIVPNQPRLDPSMPFLPAVVSNAM